MRLILALLVCVGALTLVGCKTAPINFEALVPASQADLDLLADDVAKDRLMAKDGLAAVQKDLEAAKIDASNTGAAVAGVGSRIEEVAARPASGGIGGALIGAIAGTGVLPPWLDWAVTLLGTGLGINVVRNKSRAKALAKAAGPKAPASPPA